MKHERVSDRRRWRTPVAAVVALAVSMGAMGLALGQTGAPPPATAASASVRVAQALQQADAKLGETLYTQGRAQVPACASCHGADGMGMATFPRLAGAGAHYLLEQLNALADGRREEPIMSPNAKAMSDAERASVALYISRLPARSLQPPAVPADDAGAWLATRGRWADGIPACMHCHGPSGQGVGETFPPLAGLPQEYIEKQLTHWQNALRPEGPLDLMRAIAVKLKPEDVKALARYYSSFVVAAAPAAAASGAKP